MNSSSTPALPTRSSLAPFLQRVRWEDLDRGYLETLSRHCREEDLAGAGFNSTTAAIGDRTTNALDLKGVGAAELVARESMVVCGLGMISILLEEFGGEAICETNHKDGDVVEPGSKLGTIHGDKNTLLAAERSVLNILQHLSGIATMTKRFVEILDGYRVRILDTRKTTPGLRALEKYAVASGGGWNHRFGLFDRVLIKDNHLLAKDAGEGQALKEAITMVRLSSPDLLVQVEVDRLDQITPTLEARPDALLFDNFSIDELQEGLAMVDSKAITEASGKITLDSVENYKDLKLDFISSSSLVGKAAWCDVGLDWLH